jgi:membrane protein
MASVLKRDGMSLSEHAGIPPGGMRGFLRVLKETVSDWSRQRAPSMGAALAYYATFSIAPLLFIAITVAGLFFGPDAVSGAVFAQLAELMGSDGAKAIQEMLEHVSRPKTGALAAVVGIAALLLGASTVFAELQAALNVIWEVPPKSKGSSIWKFVRTRLLSFGMVLGLTFLVVVSLLLSAALALLGKWWGPVFAAWEPLAQILDMVVNVGVLTVAFAAIYKYMPRARIAWSDVWVGAAGTALLFTIGKFLIGLYLGKSSVASSFGIFASLAIVMLWVYYSAQIFLLGAEFTHAYATRYGSHCKLGKSGKPDPACEAEPGSREPPPLSPALAAQLRRR